MTVASPPYAFVTLVTTDSYLPGALVVAAALRDLHPSPVHSPDELDPSQFHVVCLVTPETVNVQILKLLRRAFDVVIGVEIIKEDTKDALALLGRLDLGTVLTKLHVFRLETYSKIIYLDADVLPLLPLSHLFNLKSTFAAVPDVGWPDIFNSGVLVFTPGEDNFNEIMKLVVSKGSWDGGDQGVLNEWRGKDWERLSFTYNTTPTSAYTYAPAYKRFGSEIKAIHFIGSEKPWMHLPFRAPGSSSQHNAYDQGAKGCDSESSYNYSALLDLWFSVYDRHYRSEVPIFSTTGELLPTAAFRETIYVNAWDQKVTLISGATSGPFALDKLRQLALKGLGQTPTREKGEGAYMTLPLDGKIDLMSRPRAQLRLLFSRGSRITASLSRSSTDSSFSQGIQTPEDTVSLSPAEHSTPADTSMSGQWDPWSPWSGAYSNVWDLVPGIQKIAAHQFRGGVKQNSIQRGETVSTRGGQEPVYKSWEDRAESTSRDGDDEGEDEECNKDSLEEKSTYHKL